MIIIPAIDLREGKVVRLTQGAYDQESRYGVSPDDTAKMFTDAGAKRIHIVDLNGAREGKPLEMETIERLVKNIPAQYEIGGGIRKPETIEAYLSRGVAYAVLGTRACLDRGFLKEVLQAFGSQIIVGIDARDGFVATDGWTKVTSTRALDLVDTVVHLGGREVIYTDISKDGMMQGPNFDQVWSVLGVPGVKIIASGGVSGIADIQGFADMKAANLSGVIVGKAIYEGKLDLAEAIRVAAGGSTEAKASRAR